MSTEPLFLASETRGPASGPATVLLHSLALDRQVWEPAVEHFARYGRVVLLDLRGHGRSPASQVFSIEDMADDVEATLSKLGYDSAAVVGMSMGGCVAQALAIRHPRRVHALGLIDTTAWYGPTAPADWAGRAAIAADRGMRALSDFQLARWFSDEFKAANPDVCARLLDIFAGTDLQSYVASCHALGAFDAREAIGAVSVPTAVVVGERDEATPPAMAQDLHERIEGSTLHVIADSKHLTAHEKPAEVLEALASILVGSP